MTSNGTSHRLIARSLRFAVLVAAAHLTSLISHAASPAATVVTVEPTRVADLILLRGGFDAGLRQGMVCRVTRGATEIGEILLVELRPGHSAGLILSVVSRQSIRSGDIASVKTLKT
jgi:hypothetical protein